MDTITGLLAAQAARRPDAPAVFYGERTITFAELDGMGRRTAQGLHQLGVKAGDRVGLWLPNSPAYLALLVACARLGAVATAINTRFRSVEVGDIVARAGVTTLVLWPEFRGIDFLELLDEVDRAQLRGLRLIIRYTEEQTADLIPGGLEHCRRERFAKLLTRPPFEGDRAEPATGTNIFTTSGTTRAPKFVLHTNFSVARHARDVAQAFGYAADGGAILQALPLCGVFGFSQAMAAIAAGRPMVLLSAFDAGEAVRLCARRDVRHFNATDDMVLAMLEASGSEIALPGVKAAGFGSFTGDPLDCLMAAERRGLTLFGLYGMSEVQALYAKQPNDAPPERRALGGGRLTSAEARVRVRDPENGRLLTPGEQGELELSGPSLLKEYFGNPEATATALGADGFVKTGDLGYMTEDGFIFVARMGDAMRLGGFLVSPAEIENHLCRHGSVSAAQVVAAQTEKGPRPVAFVILKPGAALDEAALRDHCLSGLAKFKAPVRFAPVAEFPSTKSANGTKIQRAKLREIASELLRATSS
jgi:fatty-acyl-CoA synthase